MRRRRALRCPLNEHRDHAERASVHLESCRADGDPTMHRSSLTAIVLAEFIDKLQLHTTRRNGADQSGTAALDLGLGSSVARNREQL